MRQIVYDGLVEVQLGPAVKRSVSNDWGQVSRVVAATIAFVAVAQQFSSFEPQGFIKSTFPDGWRGQQLDCKFATPFPAAAQLYSSQLQLLGNVPSPLTPLGRGEFSGAISTGRAIIYQAGVSPAVTNPQAIPSPLPLDYKFATPVSASTQQFSAFQPRGFVQSSFPDGWRGSLEYRFGSAVPVGEQPFTPTPAPGQFLPVFGWWGQAETRVAAPLLAALRESFATLSLVPKAAAAIPSADFPALFAKPLSPGLAQTDSFQAPLTTAAASVPRGFSGYQSDRFAAPFPAAAQQYYSFAPYIAPPAANGVGDPGSFNGVLWRAPIVYQAGVSPLRPPAVAATPSVLGWASGSPAVAQFAISLGDGGDLAGFVNFQPQGWWSESPALFAKPFSPVLARTDSFQAPLTTVIVAVPQGWFGYRPERFAAPFPAAAQQYYSFTPYIAPPPATGIGNPGTFSSVLWRPPIVYQAGVSPLIQQTAAVAVPLVLGFHSERFAKPFPTAAQPYYSFAPYIAPPAADGIGDPGSFNGVLWRAPIVYQAGVSPLTPQAAAPAAPSGWWVDLPARFAKPVSAASQQYTGFFIGAPAAPQGWWPDYPALFGKNFPAAAQQYETTSRGQIASPVTPKGWSGYQFDYRFSVPYPATAQPFSVVAQLFLPTAATGIGDPGQFSSVISLPPIIYQAGVLPLAPPATVAPPVILPPAGHGDWPRKKGKVRPVWDRRPDPAPAPTAEPAPQPGPVARAPVELKPPTSPSDPSGLRRLLAPELPKPAVAPPPKAEKPRPPLAVTAALSDADDGIEAVAERGIVAVAFGIDADDSVAALAQVIVAAAADATDQADESVTGRVSAHLVANEEDDSVSTQSASDDDIALSLLFGDNDDELALALLLGDGETA